MSKIPLLKDFSISQRYFDLSVKLNDALRSYINSWEDVTEKLYTPEEIECIKKCSEIVKKRIYGNKQEE